MKVIHTANQLQNGNYAIHDAIGALVGVYLAGIKLLEVSGNTFYGVENIEAAMEIIGEMK